MRRERRREIEQMRKRLEAREATRRLYGEEQDESLCDDREFVKSRDRQAYDDAVGHFTYGPVALEDLQLDDFGLALDRGRSGSDADDIENSGQLISFKRQKQKRRVALEA